MEDDSMEIQLLLTGPEDESRLDECLKGVFDHITHPLIFSDLMMGYNFCPLTSDDVTAVEQSVRDCEQEDYIQPNMLGSFLPQWRQRRRGTRKRSKSWGVKSNHLFSSSNRLRSTCGIHSSRKNNDHWTQDEMKELVKGITNHGVGRWSAVKGATRLKTSIRTAVHVKDKWRNLVKASRAIVISKRKVQLQEATKLIVQEFKYHILEMESCNNHAKKKKKGISIIRNRARRINN
ncbi:hypothetical protein EJB05_22165 [Eragrostis curvula]|uniref:Uncharacterized protein n=1 Tax=Eragrostis curvula TaxID=38414 RepID=A0A5J9V3P0_9POAL|nr:hypothetical protein EJB05_22165 [Eragrostis curvula]